MSPPLGSENVSNTDDKTSVRNMRVPATRHLLSAHCQECVQKFKDWHSGKGAFSSPGSRDKWLTMKISRWDFHDFKKVLHIDEDEDGRFPRYSYNSTSSVLKIKGGSNPIHAKLVSSVFSALHLAVSGLPESIRSGIDIVGKSGFEIFKGRYTGSEETADMAIQIRNDEGICEVKFVLEVCFSESYCKLVEEAKVWLEGNETVSVAMLVNLVEDPCYECPTQNITEEEFAELQFPHSNEITKQPFTLDGPYGPAVYKGFTWVGRISGFVEFWRRDPGSGLATRTSGPMDLLDLANTKHTNLLLSDLIDVTPEHDQEILFGWDRYLSNLKYYIRELAVYRCYKVLLDRAGVKTVDRNYQPPSPTSSEYQTLCI